MLVNHLQPIISYLETRLCDRGKGINLSFFASCVLPAQHTPICCMCRNRVREGRKRGKTNTSETVTIHQSRFDRLDARHNLCQVSEGSVGTRQHLKDKQMHPERDQFVWSYEQMLGLA